MYSLELLSGVLIINKAWSPRNVSIYTLSTGEGVDITAESLQPGQITRLLYNFFKKIINLDNLV